MEREIQVEISLNGLRVKNNPLFCEGDTNTHFLNINFLEDLELTGYTLQIFYLPPYPSVVPLIDMFENLKSKMLIPIPNKVLLRNGKVKVEFGLSKGEEVITINKTFEFEVKKTLNSTSLTAYPEGELKLTIAQQIEKIKGLLADTDTKITEYNNNANEKTQTFNDNAVEKLKVYNDNDVLKTNAYNQNANEKISTYNENDKLKKAAYDKNATEKLKAYNDNDVSKNNKFNENAKNKTTEFDTHVTKTLNTAYADLDAKAIKSANEASQEATKLVKAQETKSIEAVSGEGIKQVGLVGTKGTEEIEKIQTAGTQAVGDVNANKDANIKAVTDEGTKQVLAVGTKGTEEVSKVQSAGTTAVENVNANKDTHVKAVADEGTKQTGLIKAEGEKQVGLVGDKGAEQTKLITDEGTKQVGLVGTKGTEETGKVGAEGKKQVGAIQNQGTLSLETILRVQKEIEALLKNQEAIGNALALNGKAGTEYDKETRNVAGGNFDPELLYLNDAGTKQKDYLYYDRLKPGVFRCLQTTTGTVNSTSNFVDISSLENANRLDNLYSSYQNILVKKDEKLIIDVNLEFEAYLVVAAHESDGVILNALLTGSKRFGNKLTISSCRSNIKIIQGTDSSKLAIESNIYGYLDFYFIPLGFFDKRINFEIQKI